MDRCRARIAAGHLIADGIVEVTLEIIDKSEYEQWRPGAHVDVVLNSGLIRQYSLLPCESGSYRIAVLAEPTGRGGSMQLHEIAQQIGTEIAVSRPRNHFELEVPIAGYCFLAGGIGITPLISMIHQAEENSVPWSLYYGGKSRRAMAYASVLTNRYGSDRVVLLPQNDVGLPDVDAIVSRLPPGTDVYCCGPEAMIAAVQRAADDRSVPFRCERFTGTAQAPAPGEDTQFEVELRYSGQLLTVPANRGMLDVIRDVLPDMPWSCEEGFCGTCETDVLEGVPDHRDIIRSPEEQACATSMMICVGRSRSPRLVLGL